MERSLQGLPPITRSNGPHSWIWEDKGNVMGLQGQRQRERTICETKSQKISLETQHGAQEVPSPLPSPKQPSLRWEGIN